jgi:hypothetical protein
MLRFNSALCLKKIGEDILMTDLYGRAHVLFLHKHYPRTGGIGNDNQTEAAQ